VFDKLSENNIDDLRDSLIMHTDQTVIHYAEYLLKIIDELTYLNA
jgi:hypothetical protein